MPLSSAIRRSSSATCSSVIPIGPFNCVPGGATSPTVRPCGSRSVTNGPACAIACANSPVIVICTMAHSPAKNLIQQPVLYQAFGQHRNVMLLVQHLRARGPELGQMLGRADQAIPVFLNVFWRATDFGDHHRHIL